MAPVPDVFSIQLNHYCLFCLNECQEAGKPLSSSGNQTLKILFSSGAEMEKGTFPKFRNLFWKLLVGKSSQQAEIQDGVEKRQSEWRTEARMEAVREMPPVCPVCLKAIEDMRKLYTELEKIQMLLVEQIGILQGLVNDGRCRAQELQRKADSGQSVSFPQESLSKVEEFQDAVISQKIQSVSVPLVLLEKVPNVSRPVTSFSKRVSQTNVAELRKRDDRPLNDLEESLMDDGIPARKRRRGRPPKKVTEQEVTIGLPKAKGRGRGRPKKSQGIATNIKTEDGPDKLEIAGGTDKEDEESKLDSDRDLRSSPMSSTNNLDGGSSDDEDYVPWETNSSNNPVATSSFKLLENSTTPKIPKKKGRKPKPKPEPAARQKVHLNVFRCKTCGKIYFKRMNFLKHQRAHEQKLIPDTKQDDQNPLEFDLEETVTCQMCQVDLLESDYNSHMLSHEGNIAGPEVPEENDVKLFSCSHKDCTMSFRLRENLRIHEELDHNELNLRCLSVIKKCDICNICYDSSNSLLAHMNQAHKNLRTSFIYCPTCSHCFTSRESMIIHTYSHAASNQQLCFQCPAPDRTEYSNRTELLQHFREAHDLKTSGECSICTTTFDDAYWLDAHLRNVHRRKEFYVCSDCGKTIYHPSTFMKHYTSQHRKVEKSGVVCEFCQEKFPNENKLAKHRVVLHGAPKIPCEHCGMEYITPKSLKEHIENVHEEKGHRCEVCNKIFRQKINLTEHMASHSNERPYTCELCGAGLKTYWQFRMHLQSHNKKHCCPICNRKFTRNISLRRHMNIHTGQVTPCPYCGYEFHSDKSLKRHMKNYHVGDESKIKPLYPPQKRMKPRSFWKDDDGNYVYATNVEPTPAALKIEKT